MAMYKCPMKFATGDPRIFGVEGNLLNYNDSSPYLTRTDDAANLGGCAFFVQNAIAGRSPFDEISPWKDIRRVTDDSLGELVEIPKFYYKWTATNSKLKLQISMVQHEGFLTSPAHADRGDGAGERDFVYVGRYNCNSAYKSISGDYPVTQTTRSGFRAGIHGKNVKAWQFDIAMLWTIRMLFLVETKSWSAKDVIGNGSVDYPAQVVTGSTDSMTYHTGTMATNRGYNGHIQYRYIEDPYGYCAYWCEGIHVLGKNIYIIKNPSQFADTGGTNIGTTQFLNTYIGGWNTFLGVNDPTLRYILMPANASADTTHGVRDYYDCNKSDIYSNYYLMYAGGDCSDANLNYKRAGMFAMFFKFKNTQTYGYLGGRLMKLP